MRASVGSCESMRGLDQHGDDGELVFVAGGVEHDGGWRDQIQTRYRVNLGPPGVRCRAGDIKGQHRVKMWSGGGCRWANSRSIRTASAGPTGSPAASVSAR